MLTVDDIKKLAQVFSTKEELQQVREEMATKKEVRQIITILDKVMGELKGIRQDNIFNRREQERTQEQIEERFSKLEKTR